MTSFSPTNSISAFAPATIANVGCGFDVLGLAVSGLGDTVVVQKSTKPGIRIVEITGDGGRLSKHPKENIVGILTEILLSKLNISGGIDISLKKGLPLGSGLGSSAASSVATVQAVNKLFDEPFSNSELFQFALEGERFACGTPHADNVAPAIYGGVTLIRKGEQDKGPEVIPIDLSSEFDDVFLVLATPAVEVRTEDSRAILPESIPLWKATQQWGNIAALVLAFERGDLELLRRSFPDYVVEPLRSGVLPKFRQVQQLAYDMGALGCSISGSGPTIFSFCKGRSTAELLEETLINFYREAELGMISHVTQISRMGIS